MIDIATSEDVRRLVDAFYAKAVPDPVIGHFFTDVAKLDLAAHLPILYAFWESTLLGTPGYKGNPMEKHIALNRLSALRPEHFQRWLSLWEETVGTLYSGPKADEARQRARRIAELMEWKVKSMGT